MSGRKGDGLSVAARGVCHGHPCDSCRTCLGGRCCRRDNPDYRLPNVGDWDGPVYGEIGVANVVGDTMECHACGGFFLSVGVHARRTHDLLADEYKAVFGLFRSKPLCGPATSDRHSLVTNRTIKSGRAKLLCTRKGEGFVSNMTPEMRSDVGKRSLHRFDDGDYSLSSSEAQAALGMRRGEFWGHVRQGRLAFRKTPYGRLFARSAVARLSAEAASVPARASEAEDVDLGRWQTRANAALVLGVGRKFVSKLIKSGALRARTQGGRVLVEPESLRAVLMSRSLGLGARGRSIRGRPPRMGPREALLVEEGP